MAEAMELVEGRSPDHKRLSRARSELASRAPFVTVFYPDAKQVVRRLDG